MTIERIWEIFWAVYLILCGVGVIGAVIYERIKERRENTASLNGKIVYVEYGEETVVRIGYKFKGQYYECDLHEGMQLMNKDTKVGRKLVVYICRNVPDLPMNIYRMSKSGMPFRYRGEVTSVDMSKSNWSWIVDTTCQKIIGLLVFVGLFMIGLGLFNISVK